MVSAVLCFLMLIFFIFLWVVTPVYRGNTNGSASASALQSALRSSSDDTKTRITTSGESAAPVAGGDGGGKAATPTPGPSTASPTAADVHRPLAVLHTDLGDITWELFPEDAPKTVANFVRMSREGVFNRSCFYRYEKGFVLQGGLHCNRPPPHHGKAKNVPLEYKRRNEKYTVALARAGADLNSGGTEFFINLRDNSNSLGPGKKGGYAVFAAVADGMDTIAAMKKLPTKTSGLTRFVSPQPTILWIEIRNYNSLSPESKKASEDP